MELTKKEIRLIDESKDLRLISKMRNLVHYLMDGLDEDDLVSKLNDYMKEFELIIIGYSGTNYKDENTLEILNSFKDLKDKLSALIKE